jgi:hypothetical protein
MMRRFFYSSIAAYNAELVDNIVCGYASFLYVSTHPFLYLRLWLKIKDVSTDPFYFTSPFYIYDCGLKLDML